MTRNSHLPVQGGLVTLTSSLVHCRALVLLHSHFLLLLPSGREGSCSPAQEDFCPGPFPSSMGLSPRKASDAVDAHSLAVQSTAIRFRKAHCGYARKRKHACPRNMIQKIGVLRKGRGESYTCKASSRVSAKLGLSGGVAKAEHLRSLVGDARDAQRARGFAAVRVPRCCCRR